MSTFPAGKWIIVGHLAPGISAMSAEEAESWLGKVAEYTPRQASFDGDVCDSPTYESSIIQPDDFLLDFRVQPESLGYGEGSIEMVRVYCAGHDWIAPGSTLIRLGEDKWFLFWDGVFFLLQKQ